MNEADVDGGRKAEAQGLKIERCRFLEEAGCASICINCCKIPTQVGNPVPTSPGWLGTLLHPRALAHTPATGVLRQGHGPERDPQAQL